MRATISCRSPYDQISVLLSNGDGTFRAGQGVGAGASFASGGVKCLDVFTSIVGNAASTSDNDVFGVFMTCP